MKLITTLLIFSIAILIPFLDQTNYAMFLYGIIYTLYIEILIFIWILRYRMLKRINNSKLRIGFKQIANMINSSTNFQSYIPDDSDKQSQTSLSLSAYEPSQVDEAEQVEQIDEVQAAVQKSRIQQQADLYLTQIKNYFGSQKLPLIKLDRKGILQKYQCVTNLTDSLLTYYSNLEKSFDIQLQSSILSKFSKNNQVSVIEQIDFQEHHKILFSDIQNDQKITISLFLNLQGRNVVLPNWNMIRQQIKQLNNVFQQQRNQILKIAQPQIQQIQKTYLEEYKNMKKLKNQLSSQYDEVFRRNQNLEGQKQLLEKDIEQNNQIYRELKKNKSAPEKLIKTEMQIKLQSQQLQTIQHKLQSSKAEMKELQQVIITKTNEQFNEFKDNWDRQFVVMYQTITRSLLQNHFDNYSSYQKSFKNSIKLQYQQPDQTQVLNQILTSPTQVLYRQSRTISIDEIDPPRLIRSEKDELQELIKKFKQYEDQIHSFEKYDSECLDFFVELGEIIKKTSQDEQQIQLSQLSDYWVSDLFQKNFPKNAQFYLILYNTIKQITTIFVENRSKLYKEYKETQLSVKERLNNITYLFNCILKDSEKFHQKVDGFTDYQRLKTQFKQNYAQYIQESEQVKIKLANYENKYKKYIEQHSETVSKTKLQIILAFATLSNNICSHTMKVIDEFDEAYQKQDHIVKSLLQKKQSHIYSKDNIKIVQQSSQFNKSLTQAKTSSRSNSLNAKQPNETINSLKETYVLRQLIKVLFLQWTKSIYFRQKFMTELYRSLNKKRPSQLDEIYVTQIDIGGEPPEVLQFIPQKSTNSCIFDLELSFRGYFYMELETYVTISWAKKHLPVNIKVKITSLNGKLRLCYTPNFIGRSWVAFVGEPSMNLSIEPTISKFNISVANDIIKEFLIYKIKMLTYPNKETITVPLAEFETEIPLSALEKIKQFVDKMKS